MSDVRQEESTDNFLELPPSVFQFGPVRIPVAGGFYLRLLPIKLSLIVLKHLEANGNRLILYFHPWELASNVPRVNVSLLSNFSTYYGVGSYLRKFEQLLKAFKFSRMDEVCGELLSLKIEASNA